MADLRMPDLNRVFLSGRLARDPELRYLPSGTPLCTLRLASSRNYRTRDGERREETLFINAKCWRGTAEWVGENLKKGNPVLVEGRLQSNEWEDKNTGQKRSMIEITADRVQSLEWGDGNRASGQGRSERPAPRNIEEPVPEDDIPF